VDKLVILISANIHESFGKIIDFYDFVKNAPKGTSNPQAARSSRAGCATCFISLLNPENQIIDKGYLAPFTLGEQPTKASLLSARRIFHGIQACGFSYTIQCVLMARPSAFFSLLWQHSLAVR